MFVINGFRKKHLREVMSVVCAWHLRVFHPIRDLWKLTGDGLRMCPSWESISQPWQNYILRWIIRLENTNWKTTLNKNYSKIFRSIDVSGPSEETRHMLLSPSMLSLDFRLQKYPTHFTSSELSPGSIYIPI